MIFKTLYSITDIMLSQARDFIPSVDFKLSLNVPTGDFFYDRWEIKSEFKNTIWDEILKTLPDHIGEARLIVLSPGRAYQTHADIDDRYHLNLLGNNSYLIDLDHQQMFPIECDNCWYHMSTQNRHTAANFGYIDRVQLVVRQLLKNNLLDESATIKICATITDADRARFIFDDQLSPWLNRANKEGIIRNFQNKKSEVIFCIERYSMQKLLDILPKEFKIEYL
jgi:hypothetical protein